MNQKNEYCMMFSNEEIIEYLIHPLEEYPQLDIRILGNDDIELPKNTEERIEFIALDGKTVNFAITFWDHKTSIYISDEDKAAYKLNPRVFNYTFNEEFMFIDENAKQYFCGCDTYRNVVYEGTLHSKTKKEILELFYEFILVLIGAKKILVEETIMSQEELQYPKCSYVVWLYNESGIKKRVQFENIQFIVNEETDRNFSDEDNWIPKHY